MPFTGYCTASDIEDEFKATTFGASTVVTATQIAEWILQESNFINARVGLRYDVSSLDESLTPEAWSVLKRIAIFRVSERVKNKLEVKSNVSQKNSEEKYTQNYVRTPNDDLDLIIKGLLLLPSAALVAKNGGVNSFVVDNYSPHKFDVNKQQW